LNNSDVFTIINKMKVGTETVELDGQKEAPTRRKEIMLRQHEDYAHIFR
jgi:hypothetical protein